MKTGILLTNIGTPAAPTARAVRGYLKEFLSDKRVVEIPKAIWLPILHSIILPTRSKKSAAFYQKIWTKEGSPLLIFSKKIADALGKKLQLPVALGMHYGKPSIETALKELQIAGVNHIILLPLYPQYSATTSAASFDRVAALLKTWRNLPSLHFIRDYAAHPDYIEAVVNSIQDYWQTHSRAEHLLFSFHGIPEHFVKSGDPYPAACHMTAQLISEKLKLKTDEWSVSFQSRLGRAKWLMPYTDMALKNFPRKGIKHLQVVCPGFATDCLETLEEIAIRGKEQFLQAGGEKFEYISALNDSDAHIEALSNVMPAFAGRIPLNLFFLK